MKMDDVFQTKLNKMYADWHYKYRRDFRKKRPKSMDGKRILLREQLEFITIYIGHMINDGNTPKNLARIKRFLLLQEPNSKGKLEIHFSDGSPFEVIINVNKIK